MTMEQDVIKHFNVPERLQKIANVIRWDLLYGPTYVVAPGDDWSKWTEDCHGDHTSYDELEAIGKPVETYASPLAEELRNYIDELPSEIYYDTQCGHVSENEPEAEEIDGEVIEPVWEDWYRLERREIVKFLFGNTIASEFY